MKHNNCLKQYNSFGVQATCDELIRFHSQDDIINWLTEHKPKQEQLFILGDGSNILLIDHINKTFLQPAIKGIRYQELDDGVLATVGAGVSWHELVLQTLEEGYFGLENLSLIPGNVGAAPIQNIGAYGVELKDVFVSLNAIEIATAKEVIFSKDQCEFDYRYSIFKGPEKGKYIITAVTLKLSKQPNLKLDYGLIRNELANTPNITPKDVSHAVINIRSSKLPDPKILGNAGSFFKNPMITTSQLSVLQKSYPDVVAYPMNSETVKLAAGWLIEKAGLKGFRLGDAGVHEKQALVLVNYGQATGMEILTLAKYIQTSVLDKFSVLLEPEVWIIGNQDLF